VTGEFVDSDVTDPVEPDIILRPDRAAPCRLCPGTTSRRRR
jgi:hypothetical protein